MNADQRAAALARCEAATPGPWDRQTMQPSMDGWHQMTLRSESVPGPAGAVIGAAFRARLADAEFIAHARTDLEAALTMLAAIEVEICGWSSFATHERDRIRKILEGNGG